MDPKLRAAIDDSYYLLLFCTRAQIEPISKNQKSFEEAVQTITLTHSKIEHGEDLTAEDRSSFWKAFIELSNLCFPASVESLRYSFDEKAGRIRKVSSRFVICAFGMLITTIVCCLAWIVGQATLDQYTSDYSQYAGMASLSRFHDEGRVLHATIDANTKKLLVSTEGLASAVVELPSDQLAAVLQIFPGLLEEDRDRTSPSRGPKQADRTIEQGPFETASSGMGPRGKELAAAEDRLNEEVDVSFLCDIARDTLAWEVFCPCNAKLSVKRRHLMIADQLVAHFTNLDTDRRTLLMLTGPFETASWILATLHIVPPDAAPPPRTMPSPDGAKPRCISFDQGQSAAAAPATSTQCGLGSPCSHEVAASSGICNAAPHKCVQAETASKADESTTPSRLGQDLREALLIFVGLLKMGRPIPILPPPPLESLAAVQLKAHLALSVLSKYFLPLLFGLLGACVHVVREINSRSENFTLVPSALRRYWARVVLGAVAGPFIGLFFDPSGKILTIGTGTTAGPSLSSQLSPLAMAFLAGFSVEILFSILDRFIKVFRDFAYGDARGPVRH